MNRSKMAADILRLVGGKENVASVTNCMTRLRFQLKDHKKADVEALKRLDGVQGVVTKNGQFQVVIGTDVGDVCAELKNWEASILMLAHSSQTKTATSSCAFLAP